MKPSKQESGSTELEDDPLISSERTKRKCVWPATYACTVASFGLLLLGFAMGFNSPVLSSLKSRTGYTSLHKTRDQDLFNVSTVWGCHIL